MAWPPTNTRAMNMPRYRRIAEAVRGGMSIADAAAKFKRDPATIWRSCRIAGFAFGAGGSIGPRANRGRMHREIARAAKGCTIAELASQFGVSKQVARSACVRYGGPPPRPVHTRHARVLRERAALKPRAAELIAAAGSEGNRRIARLLLKTSLKFDDIGVKCGVTRQRVHQVWRLLW